MRRAACLLAALSAGPARADTALLDFIGGQGCTFGQDSRAAARDAGFDDAAIDALIAGALAQGTARRQGDFVVLDATVCTIRLPDIRSDWSVTSPRIAAWISPVDAFADPGCFLDARPFLTDAFMTGDPDARLEAYLDFLAAAVIAGDVRQYGTSALRTPRGLQVLTGACADVADIAAIRATHPVIAAGFGEYVRRLGAAMPCGGSGEPLTPLRIASEIQGHPYVDGQEMPAGVNAWLWLEYDFIFLAMGWHDGVSATRRGHPRPPLCHYGTMP